jgi:hypothetical protein
MIKKQKKISTNIMKTKEKKFLFAGLLILALSYAGYRWDKSRNLDNYYVDQFCLDWELQASKGLSLPTNTKKKIYPK